MRIPNRMGTAVISQCQKMVFSAGKLRVLWVLGLAVHGLTASVLSHEFRLRALAPSQPNPP